MYGQDNRLIILLFLLKMQYIYIVLSVLNVKKTFVDHFDAFLFLVTSLHELFEKCIKKFDRPLKTFFTCQGI